MPSTPQINARLLLVNPEGTVIEVFDLDEYNPATTVGAIDLGLDIHEAVVNYQKKNTRKPAKKIGAGKKP